MADYVFLVLGIVAIGGIISIAGIVTDYRTKQSKLKIEELKHEIELEKIRKDNYIVESEKIRLEIEQTRQQLLVDQSTLIDSQSKEKS